MICCPLNSPFFFSKFFPINILFPSQINTSSPAYSIFHTLIQCDKVALVITILGQQLWSYQPLCCLTFRISAVLSVAVLLARSLVKASQLLSITCCHFTSCYLASIATGWALAFCTHFLTLSLLKLIWVNIKRSCTTPPLCQRPCLHLLCPFPWAAHVRTGAQLYCTWPAFLGYRFLQSSLSTSGLALTVTGDLKPKLP